MTLVILGPNTECNEVVGSGIKASDSVKPEPVTETINAKMNSPNAQTGKSLARFLTDAYER